MKVPAEKHWVRSSQPVQLAEVKTAGELKMMKGREIPRKKEYSFSKVLKQNSGVACEGRDLILHLYCAVAEGHENKHETNVEVKKVNQ